jgi:hypothetical protein
VWREALCAFQRPEDFIEPALGGPDTTERVLTSCGFRLLRLTNSDTCSNIGDKIDDHFANKGRLTVTLQPVVAVGGDCPVVDAGGYVGFEHNLYRVEVAEMPNGSPVHIKWSQFNGGLVGRGSIDPLRPGFVQITANLQPIITSGITDFYLETREYSAADGYWRTTYGGLASLNNANELVLPLAATFGAVPAAGREFRPVRPIRSLTASVSNFSPMRSGGTHRRTIGRLRCGPTVWKTHWFLGWRCRHCSTTPCPTASIITAYALESSRGVLRALRRQSKTVAMSFRPSRSSRVAAHSGLATG